MSIPIPAEVPDPEVLAPVWEDPRWAVQVVLVWECLLWAARVAPAWEDLLWEGRVGAVQIVNVAQGCAAI